MARKHGKQGQEVWPEIWLRQRTLSRHRTSSASENILRSSASSPTATTIWNLLQKFFAKGYLATGERSKCFRFRGRFSNNAQIPVEAIVFSRKRAILRDPSEPSPRLTLALRLLRLGKRSSKGANMLA